MHINVGVAFDIALDELIINKAHALTVQVVGAYDDVHHCNVVIDTSGYYFDATLNHPCSSECVHVQLRYSVLSLQVIFVVALAIGQYWIVLGHFVRTVHVRQCSKKRTNQTLKYKRIMHAYTYCIAFTCNLY